MTEPHGPPPGSRNHSARAPRPRTASHAGSHGTDVDVHDLHTLRRLSSVATMMQYTKDKSQKPQV